MQFSLDTTIGQVAVPIVVAVLAFRLGYWFTGKHLNRADGVPLKAFLERGGWEPAYRRALTAVLDWLDRRLTPPEWHDRLTDGECAPDPAARAWNWWAYDRMLLLAVAYPILLPLLFWVGAGSPATLGGREIMPTPENALPRILVGGGLLVMLVLVSFLEPLAHRVHHMIRFLIGSPFSRARFWRAAGPEQGREFVRAVLAAGTVAGAIAFAFTAAIPGSLVVGVAFSVAVGVAFAGAVVGAGVVTGAIAFAFAGAVVAGALVKRRWRPTIVLAFFSVAAGATLAVFYYWTPWRSSEHSVLRLRTHSQKMTVAARAMAERKTLGHRS